MAERIAPHLCRAGLEKYANVCALAAGPFVNRSTAQAAGNRLR
jgi:hypothetical protein